MKQLSYPWTAKRRDHHDPNGDSQIHELKDCPRYPRTAKRRDHHDPNVDSQIHELKDCPPYGSIRMTNHGIVAVRPESENFRAVDSWGAPESEYTSYGNRVLGDKDERACCGPNYGRERTTENSYKVHEEDINDEAQEFIEMEHQKFNLRKWISTNSISY
ncbi:hypothetical protein ACH5RR_035574 [Cinchona calisaya]|uniref:Uncharacterized protein n=1 Tax=Cinchona calisaya TaxID=153742 RepID=A0ABD2Y2X4_9GENT